MSTVKRLFEDAIRYEESFLAHYIYCLLKEEKITLEDDDSILSEVQPDSAKLVKMVKENHLGFCQVKMFALKARNTPWIFIFAKNLEEAEKLLLRETGQRPLRCREIIPDQVVYVNNRFFNFHDLKKQQSKFPCLVGYHET
ncbi:hypothetical protein [Lederbergia panacisoli]|uniref:hypothetical protein n=1 Tax=Lederbergia panacisoli TaxID=1255251 RepID=UPI00214AA0C5|nr:hypothetical protein [Lederbergia panacisoli]MCR2823303.1 hypothetical protein [Lederbergia panacisoli]